ncbi:MAG: hypothetical protein U0528_01055 [Anaerolineae bacterium]
MDSVEQPEPANPLAAALVERSRRDPGPAPQLLNEVLHAGGRTPCVIPVDEFSRVMGGGIVPGSVTLIAWSQLASPRSRGGGALFASFGRVLYVLGEESSRQIKMRGTLRYHL